MQIINSSRGKLFRNNPNHHNLLTLKVLNNFLMQAHKSHIALFCSDISLISHVQIMHVCKKCNADSKHSIMNSSRESFVQCLTCAKGSLDFLLDRKSLDTWLSESTILTTLVKRNVQENHSKCVWSITCYFNNEDMRYRNRYSLSDNTPLCNNNRE